MAAPSKPYATTVQVSYLCKSMYRNEVATSSSAVPDFMLDQLIAWADGLIEMCFQAVGYIIPFTELSGETWPTAQTVWLSFASAIGAAGMASGNVLLPAPVMTSGRMGGERHPYVIMFDNIRRDIEKHGFHLRAQYYAGTKAEKWLAQQYGPRGDFWPGDWIDPTRFDMLREYTSRMEDVYSDIKALNLDWDYLYQLRSVTAA